MVRRVKMSLTSCIATRRPSTNYSGVGWPSLAGGAVLLTRFKGMVALALAFRDSAGIPARRQPFGYQLPDFDDRPGQVYRALNQAGPGNDINARSPGLQKAPTRGPASLVSMWTLRRPVLGMARD